MPRIKIYSIGKNKEKWLQEALNDYIKRLRSHAAVTFHFVKDNAQLLDRLLKERLFVCLDEGGRQFDSVAFSRFVMDKFEASGADLSFVIGGAEGLPAQLKNRNDCISLSPMTLTHQCVRLVLLEQIYRAFEIAKGSPYHK